MTSGIQLSDDGFTWCHGAVVRGLRSDRRLALVFTGGDYGEGADEILDALNDHGMRASFFFTGDFVRSGANERALRRIVSSGHYLGPHSDQHLLYCPWDNREATLVTRAAFEDDLRRNVRALGRFGWVRHAETWWIPPYEWYNETIAAWSEEVGFRLFCFTPGTLSQADYTTDDDPRFTPSEGIMRSILAFEEREAHGLSGFLLLSHVGAGDGRTDKFFRLLPDLLSELARRGYDLATARCGDSLAGPDARDHAAARTPCRLRTLDRGEGCTRDLRTARLPRVSAFRHSAQRPVAGRSCLTRGQGYKLA